MIEIWSTFHVTRGWVHRPGQRALETVYMPRPLLSEGLRKPARVIEQRMAEARAEIARRAEERKANRR